MITEENIIKFYVDNGFLLHRVRSHYHISNPEWLLPAIENIQDTQDRLMGTHRTLSLTIEQMLIKLLENGLIDI